MINGALFRREMKISVKLLLIFGAIMTLYVTCIIWMYEPETVEMLDSFTKAMPELMAAVGMTPGAADLLGFMISYLYGFILLVFPMVFCILRGNGLVARYIDQGSMVYLAAAPVKRRAIAATQMLVLLSGILLLTIYTTVLEAVTAQMLFPGELNLSELLQLNTGLLLLHFLIGGICFCASCIFSESRYSALFGGGIPALMYLFQMIANVGSSAEGLKYLSIFTLFDPNGLAAGESDAVLKMVALLAGSIILYPIGIVVFCRKDLHI